MAAHRIVIALALFCAIVNAQRPSYAGLRPIGFPALQTDLLGNRFGEDSDLPIEAKGDGNLINRLNALPADNRPFWYLNWRQYDDLRRNPQTYPARPNVFASRN